MNGIEDIKRLKKERNEIKSHLKFELMMNGNSLQVSLNEKTIKIVKFYGSDDTNPETMTLYFEEMASISDFVSQCLIEEDD